MVTKRRAGLRLQHALPNARVVYVSATGATTVHNLAYAQRLGLWGGADFPFATRAEFVEAIEEGGVAAMEVLARDLKALGLYAARSLSYEGVEYELVEHQLTPEQVRIYDAYAGAFSVIHNNLDAAMRAANITGATGTLNGQAKSAARSAFESAKQRFFGHLLTSMKTPSLIRAIENDLEAGHAAVIQIVSTGEALMERRLAEIPTEEWGDVQVDITPREYVLDYLAHSFPVQLYEPFTDSEGNLCSRPVYRDGQPVESREAVARRDRLIEKLASLPPVPGALDQVIQRFGTELVAEVTGRSRRVIRKGDRLVVENRAGSANLAETSAFMDDVKRILVFSDAGGTGRSYHAELSARNRRLRVHYLLEPGWKADAAIQGLGRTNRTNQAQPPLFRPIATDVKAEKRFLSTIARRLDTLGAITRGQRQTGGQGLFRPEDNLESQYGRDALRQLYTLLARGKVDGCSLGRFEDATGLKLMDANGLRNDLPPITTFLNRLLALTIDLQNVLFTAFEQLLTARIEGAVASGTYDVGLETLRAESLVVTDRRTIYDQRGTGAETRLLTVTQRQRNHPVSLDDALARLSDRQAVLLVNERSGRAAVQVPAASVMLDDGEIERPSDPADGSAHGPLEHDGGEPLDRSGPWALRCGLGGGACRGAPVHGKHDPRCGGLAAPYLEAAAERINPRLSAPDRCGRTHHRTQVFGHMGRKRPFEGRARADAGRCLCRADGGTHRPRPRGGTPTSPRPGDGRLSHRAVRIQRHDTRSPPCLRPLWGDHLLEAAHVRTHGRERHRGPVQGARHLSGYGRQ